MPIKARRFKSKEWNSTRKELVVEIEKHTKETGSDIKTENDVRGFLELKFHLMKGDTNESHISQVMTILRLLSFEKNDDESVTKPIDVSDMTEAELIKSLPKNIPERVSMIGNRLMENQRFFTKGKHHNLWRYPTDPEIGIWKPDGESFIRKNVADMTGNKEYRSHLCNEVFNMIRDTSYNDIIELRGPEDIVVLCGGRLNLTTKKYMEGFDSSEYQITAIPVEHDSDADCPKFKKFLSEVLDDEEDIQAIFELIGYCLWKDMPYDIFIIFVGLGANGKTVLLEVMTKFLGEENVSAVTLQRLAESKFASSRLMGKLANLAGEIPNEAIRDTSRVKDLSGGGQTDAERKFQEPIGFYNFAKLIFSANEPPAIYDDKPAIWRRLRTFKFPKTFRKGEKGTIPRDVLVATMTTPTELSGILNEALAGWARLRKYGRMTGDQKWEDQRLDYIQESNPVQFMVEKFFTHNYDSIEYRKKSLYELHLKFCVAKKLRALSTESFHKRLRIYAPYIDESRPRDDEGKPVRAYSGLDIDFAGLKENEVGLDNIQFAVLNADQTTLEDFGFLTAPSAPPAPRVPTSAPVGKGKGDTVGATKGDTPTHGAVGAGGAAKSGMIIEKFIDDPLLVKLIKMWKRSDRELNKDFKPKTDKDLTLIGRGHDSKYIEERSGGFWWFTDKAKEEIER